MPERKVIVTAYSSPEARVSRGNFLYAFAASTRQGLGEIMDFFQAMKPDVWITFEDEKENFFEKDAPLPGKMPDFTTANYYLPET